METTGFIDIDLVYVHEVLDGLEHEEGRTASVAPTPPATIRFPSCPEPSSCLQHLVAYPRLTLTYQEATSDNVVAEARGLDALRPSASMHE